MMYFVHSQKAEKVLRPNLIQFNDTENDEILENLLILLEDKDASVSLTVANLPIKRRGSCSVNCKSGRRKTKSIY